MQTVKLVESAAGLRKASIFGQVLRHLALIVCAFLGSLSRLGGRTPNSARPRELDPATSRPCDPLPRSRAEPIHDVSALVPPARAQERQRGNPDKFNHQNQRKSPRERTPSCSRAASIKSRLTLSVLARGAIGVVGSYRACSPERSPERRSANGGRPSTGQEGDAGARFPPVEQEHGEGRLMLS